MTGSGSKGDQTKLVYLAISLLTPLGRADQLYLTFLLLKIPLVISSLRFCILYLTSIQTDFFCILCNGRQCSPPCIALFSNRTSIFVEQQICLAFSLNIFYFVLNFVLFFTALLHGGLQGYHHPHYLLDLTERPPH